MGLAFNDERLDSELEDLTPKLKTPTVERFQRLRYATSKPKSPGGTHVDSLALFLTLQPARSWCRERAVEANCQRPAWGVGRQGVGTLVDIRTWPWLASCSDRPRIGAISAEPVDRDARGGQCGSRRFSLALDGQRPVFSAAAAQQDPFSAWSPRQRSTRAWPVNPVSSRPSSWSPTAESAGSARRMALPARDRGSCRRD